VAGLVLVNTGARIIIDDDYPAGLTPEAVQSLLALIAAGWGTDEFSALANPSIASNSELLSLYSRQLRASATPRTAVEQYGYILGQLDVRSVLPLVQAPTLVLHVRDNPLVPLELGRYLGDHIEGARFVEIAGGDLVLPTAVLEELIEFLTGQRPEVEINRILTTVMFTDIVGSTEQAAALGDQRWRSLLDLHDRAIREQLRRFRGREINTTGDGFVASFDGPARAIRCATSIREVTEPLGIKLRTGLHTGECELRGDDLGGLAVHIAARVGSIAAPGEVLVSGTVKDLVVGSGIGFEDRGEHELRGVPAIWRLFAVSP
jgi:class 3 adenylate cyclase